MKWGALGALTGFVIVLLLVLIALSNNVVLWFFGFTITVLVIFHLGLTIFRRH